MSLSSNPTDLILAAASKRPGGIAIRTPTLAVSYAELRDLVLSFALHLREHGVNRTSCVAIRPPDVVAAVAAIFAVAILGARWVNATKGALDSRHGLGVTHQLMELTNSDDRRSPGLIGIDAEWQRPPHGREAADAARLEGFASPSDTWMIGQSSGTTGSPKFMAISPALLQRRMILWQEIHDRFGMGLQSGQNHASRFPPLATNFVTTCLTTFGVGGCFLFGGRFPFLAGNGATTLVGSPGQVAELIRDEPPPSSPPIPVLFIGGGPSSSSFLTSAACYFERIVSGYASTESGIVCARQFMPEHSGEVSVGWPAKGAEIQVVDDNDQPLPAGEEGVVRTRTDGTVSGYLDAPDATATFFHDGWFYPGDRGVWLADDGFHITGRVTDSLNIRGVKLNAAVMDLLLQKVLGVEEGLCFAEPAPDGLASLSIMIKPAKGADPAAIAEAIAGDAKLRLNRWKAPTRLYFAQDLPKNANNKVLRQEALRLARDLKPVEVVQR